ncbi:hypothetical protein E4U45_002278 [Claviceps purpurea]|nr:hypothetical protein E4U45_002278 [Claviceps purpurea]
MALNSSEHDGPCVQLPQSDLSAQPEHGAPESSERPTQPTLELPSREASNGQAKDFRNEASRTEEA